MLQASRLLICRLFIQPYLTRHLSIFIRSGFLTVFALNGKETVRNPEFKNYLGQMYPAELEIKEITESTTSASYLDLLLSIGRDSQLHTSIYDKRDDFNFHITNFPFMSSIIPSSPAYCVFISKLIRYARACSSTECFILRSRRLSSKLFKQEYLVERLKRHLGRFMVDTGILFSNMKSPSRECWMTFWPLTNSDFPTDQTFHQFNDLYTEFDLHRIMSGIHGAFCMPAGNAYPSGHLVLSPF